MHLSRVEELSLLPIEASPRGRALPDGSGWFGSSWELRAGLEVHEGWTGDAGLLGWIENWLHSAGAAGGLSLSAT
ncbi:MAG: hypothetical protein ACXWCU_11900 [Caldimonas sp.]